MCNYSADRSIDRTRFYEPRVFDDRAQLLFVSLLEKSRGFETWSSGQARIRSRSLRLASGDLGQQGELTTNTTVIFVFFQVRPGRPFSRDRPGSRDTRITWRTRISPSSARSAAGVTRSNPACRSIWGTSAAAAGTSAVSYAGAVLRRMSVCAVTWCRATTFISRQGSSVSGRSSSEEFVISLPKISKIVRSWNVRLSRIEFITSGTKILRRHLCEEWLKWTRLFNDCTTYCVFPQRLFVVYRRRF